MAARLSDDFAVRVQASQNIELATHPVGLNVGACVRPSDVSTRRLVHLRFAPTWFVFPHVITAEVFARMWESLCV